MRFKPRRTSGRRRRRSFVSFWMFLLALVVFGQGIQMLDRNLRPAFMAMAMGVARQMATQAINDALTKRMAEDAEYARVLVVDKDKSGRITSAHFNFAEVARIESLTTLRVQHVLTRLEERIVYVPAFQAMGSAVLATVGPSIPIRIVPLGSAQSEVEPEVKTAGINQTVHILYLHIVAQVLVVVPFISQPVTVDTKIPIAYVVFIGNVPTTTIVGGTLPLFPGSGVRGGP